MYSEGLGEPYSFMDAEGNEKKNPWGFCVRIAKNGSRTKKIFYDYAMHFVNNLPHHQRKDTEPVILFIDGHSSLWDSSSLLYMMENNVFFLPSFTYLYLDLA